MPDGLGWLRGHEQQWAYFVLHFKGLSSSHPRVALGIKRRGKGCQNSWKKNPKYFIHVRCHSSKLWGCVCVSSEESSFHVSLVYTCMYLHLQLFAHLHAYVYWAHAIHVYAQSHPRVSADAHTNVPTSKQRYIYNTHEHVYTMMYTLHTSVLTSAYICLYVPMHTSHVHVSEPINLCPSQQTVPEMAPD